MPLYRIACYQISFLKARNCVQKCAIYDRRLATVSTVIIPFHWKLEDKVSVFSPAADPQADQFKQERNAVLFLPRILTELH
jgi:hypothetical protein